MPVTVQNSSSYACNDLLLNPKYDKGKIQFVLEGNRDMKPEQFPRRMQKLQQAVRKLKREYIRQFKVSILIRPLKVNVKPSISPKYLDDRGYYLRKNPEVGKRRYSTKGRNWVVSLFDIYR